MSYNVYWGDLHNHCSVSYGEGTVTQALARARQQLDFCSVTGHAFWPDMPTDRERYGEIIDYHREGFARLAGNWDALLQEQAVATQRGKFVALPSYEWHSLAYGDHNVYAPGPELALRDAGDLPALQRMMRDSGTICLPHHIGYAAGYRGIDWRYFDEEVSPVVEIFSLHGCSVSVDDPYPMLHDMGPRDAGSTAEAGWAAGHKFGIIASTDHHGGYPGSHGEGRLAVLATELSREAIWDALRQRRVYAVTGDKIDARFSVNDAWLGNTVWAPENRRVKIDVTGCDALDYVDLIKNGRVLNRWSADELRTSDKGRFRLRVSWGWGRKDEPVRWNGQLSLEDGSIETLETCFSGQSIVAPRGVGGHTQGSDQEDLPHEVLDQSIRGCAWRSVTSGNISTRHPTTQALSLDLAASLATRLILEVNGRKYEHTLAELLGAGRVHYLRGWLSEALRIGPLVPKAECSLSVELDDRPEKSIDLYRVRVAQRNGQMAWLTPVWAER